MELAGLRKRFSRMAIATDATHAASAVTDTDGAATTQEKGADNETGTGTEMEQQEAGSSDATIMVEFHRRWVLECERAEQVVRVHNKMPIQSVILCVLYPDSLSLSLSLTRSLSLSLSLSFSVSIAFYCTYIYILLSLPFSLSISIPISISLSQAVYDQHGLKLEMDKSRDGECVGK
jgi:hypothetical protein